MSKKEKPTIRQTYIDESLGVEVTQYNPDPDEWPPARREFYFGPAPRPERRDSDDDNRVTIEGVQGVCDLASELGGTFINDKRRE